jgi:hypothetical protein
VSGLDFWLVLVAGFTAGISVGGVWAASWRREASWLRSQLRQARRRLRDVEKVARDNADKRNGWRAVAQQLWVTHPMHSEWHQIRALPEVER